jgi:predicted TPR repeat methyltransferase
MDVKDAYNRWAHQYDSNQNKTRDLETIALQSILSKVNFDSCLEIGCGTGKNTAWLITKAKEITAVDFSDQMLAKAKAKINSDKVSFVQLDINTKWIFENKKYDLITFSLVLEHIQNLNNIFKQAAEKIVTGGYVYIGELHPFKQYTGSKARFNTIEGEQTVTCFTHNISDFTQAAKKQGFAIVEINEYFDEDNKNSVPRIIVLLLKML